MEKDKNNDKEHMNKQLEKNIFKIDLRNRKFSSLLFSFYSDVDIVGTWNIFKTLEL
jgi:hypothetical protein